MILLLLLTLFTVGNVIAKGPAAPPFIPDISENWTPIYPADLYPDFEFEGLSPACSNGIGTESDEFFFFVKAGNVNNLVVYFQGGGACWDPLTCLIYKPFSPDVTLDDNPENGRGMFDLQDPDNPFRDWSFVFVPYCTGDIHWGANDKEYTYSGITRTIQHRGFVNFQVVLKYITETFAKPHKIFVTGSSAGAYGALGGFPWIKEAYPKSQVSLLGDAGMGVSPPEYTQLSRPNWNTQIAPWLFDTSDSYPTVPEIWNRVAEYYPHSKIAEFTNAFDGTQIAFYGLMFLTIGIPSPPDVQMDWHTQMWEGVDYKSLSPNYRYYVAEGERHTILGTSHFYTESSAEGILFLDWLTAMIMNQGGTGGHGAMPWIDIACDACRE